MDLRRDEAVANVLSINDVAKNLWMRDGSASVRVVVIRDGSTRLSTEFRVPKGLQRRRSPHLAGLGFLLIGVGLDESR